MTVTNDVNIKSRLIPFRWSTLKILVLLALLIGIYKGYKWVYPDIPGYCYSQKRFLSDDEFMRIAIREILENPPDHQPDIDGSEASIREFIKQQPNSLHRVEANTEDAEKNNVDVWPWHVDIFMNFKTKEKSYGSSSDTYTTWTRLDECGDVIFNSGGF